MCGQINTGAEGNGRILGRSAMSIQYDDSSLEKKKTCACIMTHTVIHT
jgi:hypothetical protein